MRKCFQYLNVGPAIEHVFFGALVEYSVVPYVLTYCAYPILFRNLLQNSADEEDDEDEDEDEDE
jgi:hypothetical protein